MNGVYSQFREKAQIYLSALQALDKAVVPAKEIDTREKSEEYNDLMDRLGKEGQFAKDYMITEFNIGMTYNTCKQTEFLESIANSLTELVKLVREDILEEK